MFYWNISIVHLFTRYLRLLLHEVVEVSSYERNCMPQKAKNIYSMALGRQSLPEVIN